MLNIKESLRIKLFIIVAIRFKYTQESNQFICFVCFFLFLQVYSEAQFCHHSLKSLFYFICCCCFFFFNKASGCQSEHASSIRKRKTRKHVQTHQSDHTVSLLSSVHELPSSCLTMMKTLMMLLFLCHVASPGKSVIIAQISIKLRNDIESLKLEINIYFNIFQLFDFSFFL